MFHWRQHILDAILRRVVLNHKAVRWRTYAWKNGCVVRNTIPPVAKYNFVAWHINFIVTPDFYEFIIIIPSSTKQVLCINPFKAFATHLKEDMEQHPEKLGLTIFGGSYAIHKFGAKRAFQVLEKALEDCNIHDNEVFERNNLYSFIHTYFVVGGVCTVCWREIRHYCKYT